MKVITLLFFLMTSIASAQETIEDFSSPATEWRITDDGVMGGLSKGQGKINEDGQLLFTGTLSLEAWILFAIVFFWTPPHFWALALILQRDYSDADVPMLPVVAGEKETRVQVVLWSFVMLGVSLLPVVAGAAGLFYFLAAIGLGAIFIGLAVAAWREEGLRYTRHTFKYSLLYLALLFLALVIDAL